MIVNNRHFEIINYLLILQEIILLVFWKGLPWPEVHVQKTFMRLSWLKLNYPVLSLPVSLPSPVCPVTIYWAQLFSNCTPIPSLWGTQEARAPCQLLRWVNI